MTADVFWYRGMVNFSHSIELLLQIDHNMNIRILFSSEKLCDLERSKRFTTVLFVHGFFFSIN
jgi:hypothetical protein